MPFLAVHQCNSSLLWTISNSGESDSESITVRSAVLVNLRPTPGIQVNLYHLLAHIGGEKILLLIATHPVG
jgi:hypothetical protein